jgi:predicted O-methyltransferase YrrM
MIRLIYKYLYHIFTARNSKGFGIHSPFIFQFFQFVLLEKNPFYIFNRIEKERLKLLNDNSLINVVDFGTGINRTRKVSDIARKSLKPMKFGKLLFRMINYYKAKNILELGTSLGITSSYLASASSDLKLTTLEGCPETARIANETFRDLEITNVNVVIGNIDETLSKVLDNIGLLDFIFIDANHHSVPLLNYFEKCISNTKKNCIIVIDDIYWSEDMEMAWNKIKNHDRVMSTIDLFHIGIIFLNSDLSKKHYKLIF